MKRYIVASLVGAMALSACGSESSTTVSTVARDSEDSVVVDSTITDSLPEDSSPDGSTEAPIGLPDTFELPVANLPPCEIPPTLAVDSTGRAYQISEPSCAGGWMFAYSTECEYECESSLAIESVNGQWQLRGWVYNMCYEGAAGSFGLPKVVALWHIRWSCEGDSEDDVYRPVAEPAVGSLSLGDYGPRVAELDRALSAGGFLVEAPNDAFDFGTLKAVLDLQFQLSLDVDGYAGPMTLGALGLA
jgi:hypothetical protein